MEDISITVPKIEAQARYIINNALTAGVPATIITLAIKGVLLELTINEKEEIITAYDNQIGERDGDSKRAESAGGRKPSSGEDDIASRPPESV